MPRRPKDPNNPITKLRRQLSSSNQQLTREMFAKRYGFSVETLKALETDRYRLTQDFAIKIGVAVGVDPNSMLENRDPLVDWHGNPITPETVPALRHLDLNANARLECLIDAGFAAAKKHPKGDRSALYVVLFDFWLASVMKDWGVIGPFWDELFDRSDADEFELGKDRWEEDKQPPRYIDRPKEVRIGDYGFHEAVARGLARSAMLDAERKRLLLEYLTPAEIAEYDRPIPIDKAAEVDEAMNLAYRRFAKSKGINPDDYQAVSEAFSAEAWRRFHEQEQGYFRQQDSANLMPSDHEKQKF